MREARWRPSARLQLDGMIQYIRDRDRLASERLEQSIVQSVERIRAMPMIGRPGRVVETREWSVHPNYLIIYRVTADQIIILRILHARQRYP